MSSPAVKQQEWAEKEGQGLSKEDIVRAMNASTGEGPGRFLRQFRELAGMSEMEAASRMTISLHQLNALESDDFEQLPAPIYVRSYLRRFAEIFELPMSDLLTSYERCESSRDPQIARVSQKERIHSRGVSAKWVVYGIGALFILLSLWVAKTAGLDEWVQNMAASGQEEVQDTLPIPAPVQQSELMIPEDMAPASE